MGFRRGRGCILREHTGCSENEDAACCRRSSISKISSASHGCYSALNHIDRVPRIDKRIQPGGLLHILIEPIDPVVIYVGFPYGRVVGKVRRHGNGDKFYDDTVVLQRVIEGVSVGDRYVWVAGVVKDLRGRREVAGIGDGRLFCVVFRVLFFPRRAAPPVTHQYSILRETILVNPAVSRAPENGLPSGCGSGNDHAMAS